MRKSSRRMEIAGLIYASGVDAFVVGVDSSATPTITNARRSPFLDRLRAAAAAPTAMYTQGLLLLLPTPDFSMTFNVAGMTGTAVERPLHDDDLASRLPRGVARVRAIDAFCLEQIRVLLNCTTDRRPPVRDTSDYPSGDDSRTKYDA